MTQDRMHDRAPVVGRIFGYHPPRQAVEEICRKAIGAGYGQRAEKGAALAAAGHVYQRSEDGPNVWYVQSESQHPEVSHLDYRIDLGDPDPLHRACSCPDAQYNAPLSEAALPMCKHMLAVMMVRRWRCDRGLFFDPARAVRSMFEAAQGASELQLWMEVLHVDRSFDSAGRRILPYHNIERICGFRLGDTGPWSYFLEPITVSGMIDGKFVAGLYTGFWPVVDEFHWRKAVAHPSRGNFKIWVMLPTVSQEDEFEWDDTGFVRLEPAPVFAAPTAEERMLLLAHQSGRGKGMYNGLQIDGEDGKPPVETPAHQRAAGVM